MDTLKTQHKINIDDLSLYFHFFYYFARPSAGLLYYFKVPWMMDT